MKIAEEEGGKVYETSCYHPYMRAAGDRYERLRP